MASGWIAQIPRHVRVSQAIAEWGVSILYRRTTIRDGLLGGAVLLALVGLLLVFGGDRRTRRGGGVAAAIAGFVWVAPLALGLLSRRYDYFLSRNVIPAVVPLAVLLGAACVVPRLRALGVALALALLALFSYATIRVQTHAYLQRPDWRSVARALGPATVPRAIIAANGFTADPLKIYLRRVNWVQPQSQRVLVQEIDVVGDRKQLAAPAGSHRPAPGEPPVWFTRGVRPTPALRGAAGVAGSSIASWSELDRSAGSCSTHPTGQRQAAHRAGAGSTSTAPRTRCSIFFQRPERQARGETAAQRGRPRLRVRRLPRRAAHPVDRQRGQITDRYEFVFVDDRSLDDGWSVLQRLAAEDEHVRAFRLSRNFGQDAAITAGLAQARGDWAVVMDCDLQEAPEDIPRLWAAAGEGYDIVRTTRRGWRHSAFRRCTSRVYRRLTLETDVRPDYCNLSLLSRRVIDAFLRLRDRDREYMIALDWLGFDSTTVEIEHHERHAGESGYTLRRLIRIALDGMFFRSTVLLRLVVLLGFVVALIGVIVAGFEIADYFIEAHKRVPGLHQPRRAPARAGRVHHRQRRRGRAVRGADLRAGQAPAAVPDRSGSAESTYTRSRPPGIGKRLQHPLPVALHQAASDLLGEALRVAADARVGRPPSHPGDKRVRARGQVANRLGDDHPVARGGEHPIDDPLGAGQEVVQAGLEDDRVGARERLRAGGEVEQPRIDATGL